MRSETWRRCAIQSSVSGLETMSSRQPDPFRCTPSFGPRQEPKPAQYLYDRRYDRSAFNVQLEVELTPRGAADGTVVTRSNYRNQYWSYRQQAAHHTVAGCALASVPSPPCVTATWVVGAVRVLAGGIPVIIQTSQAVCAASGQGLIIAATQPRVIAT